MTVVQQGPRKGLLSTKVLLICLISLLTLTACSTSDEGVATHEERTLVEGLRFSSAADLSNASTLDTSVVTGDIHIFVDDITGVQRVNYYINDVEGLGLPHPGDNVERINPASSLETSSILSTDELADGIHTFTAMVQRAEGPEAITATFLVNNSGTLSDQLLVSQSADRSGAVALGGETLSGNAYVFLVPGSSAKQVAFYIDDTSRSRAPHTVERFAFYDMATTASGGKAYPYDTKRLSDGAHTITAEITYSTGSKKVVSSSFQVKNGGGSAPAPSPSVGNWDNRDIGNVGVKGSVNQSGSTLSVKASGTDIWNTDDQFHYVYQKLSGDAQLVVKVGSLQRTDGWAKAGVMIRSDLSTNSPNMAAFVTPDHGSVSQTRLSKGVRTYSTIQGENHPWLKIVRKGTRLETYSSANGSTWKRLSVATLSLSSNAVVGLAVTSHKNSAVTTAVFSNVSLSSSTPSPSPDPDPDPNPTPAPAPSKDAFDLRGDPNFSVSQLTAEQQKWYKYLWAAINHPDQQPNATKSAQSDDLYKFRGDLHDYVFALLTAFRVTGDLRLLDDIDRKAQMMRADLADSWRGTKDGTDGKKDGFLNWVDRYNTSKTYAGKDTQRAYDMKAHALVAQIAYALDNNRDLKSPAGINYGAHADFWESYLVNHFEKKWRTRNGKMTGFPFVEHPGSHSFHSWMKWHYYMGKLTGKSGYTNEAMRMANILWGGHFVETSSKYGTAYVWRRGVMKLVDAANPSYDQFKLLQPSTYARYTVGEAIDFHFEGFSNYRYDSTIRKFANSIAAFYIDDSGFNSFARDIGGGVSRAGIPASSTSFSRDNQARFGITAFPMMAAWDKNSGNRIYNASKEVFADISNVKYGRDPKRVFIPVAMLLHEELK